MSVLVFAWAQPATPPPPVSEAFVVATAAEEVIGTWHVLTHYFRFDEDGTFREAVGEDALDAMPYAINAYRFEEAVMLVTEVAVSGLPSCGDAVGRYEVRLVESGNLQIVLIEDPCKGRSGNIVRVYEPTESRGHVAVTSAEQILGTWVSQIGAAAVRFDEDGTVRSARSANTLESAPYAISSYRFEDAVMLVTEVAVSGVPSCGDAVGRYKVWPLGNGHLQIVAIDDLCDARAGDMTREYAPVEAAGYVVVTSAEQILGSWASQIGAAAIRFDEDGAYREAWGVSMLDTAPFVISTYGFDAAVMLVAGGTVVGVPDCGEAVGRYEVRLSENGSLQILPIEDPCLDRREHMRSMVYERVE